MPLGGVTVSGQDVGDSGASSCSGTARSFGGITDFAMGISDHPEAKVNATWSVAWDYSGTAFSACLANGTQGFVPNDSATNFNNTCSL